MTAKVTAKVASQVSEQLPSFISEDFPLYEKFVENYYDFLETVTLDYAKVTGYENAFTFTLGETITGQSSGAKAKVKGTGANSGLNKLFIEPSNDLDFIKDETFIGSTSSSYGSVSKLVRNPSNSLRTFLSLIDPTSTTSGILDFFKKEFYSNFRETSLVDFRKLISNLESFYRSKGSENSFRTLFRILYGQDNLDFYFPKTDLLKVSDGIWAQDTVLQVPNATINLSFNGLTITGSNSKSTAFVSNITDRKIGTISVLELVLTNRVGSFTLGENISATTSDGDIITAKVTGQLLSVDTSDTGTGYNANTSLTITDSTLDGFGAAGKISEVSGDQVTLFNITNGGNGYQINDSIVFDNTGTNVDVTAEAKVRSLSDAYTLDVVTTEIHVSVTTLTFNIDGASTSLPFSVNVQSGLLVANNLVFNDSTKKGEIISITNSELVIYDNSRTDSNLSAWVDGDSLFLFDSGGVSVTGSTSCVINDSSITNPSTDIVISSGDYGVNLNNERSSSTIQSAMTTENQTFGKIESIDITSHGSGYDTAPTVSITNGYYSNFQEADSVNGGFKGQNANISVGTLGGEITKIEMTEEGFGYVQDPTIIQAINPAISLEDDDLILLEDDNLMILESTFSGSSRATFVPTLSDIKTKDGKFTDESGKPSSQKKIQDNDYYQDFSYVIQTSDSINVWRQDILKLLHPAGMKLFGEVAVQSILNASMFDRGLNNINSVLANGVAEYREIMLIILTEILNNSKVQVETSLVKEVEQNLFTQNIVGQTFIEMEDGGNLRNEEGGRIEYSQFFEDEVISTIIEQLRLISSSAGVPSDFFSLMSVKNVDTIVRGTKILNEDNDNILLEDGTSNFLLEQPNTTIRTTEPHYFRVNDEIFLDQFVGTNVDKLNKRLFKVNDVDIENSKIGLEGNDNLLLESGGFLINEDVNVFTLSDPISLTDYGSLEIAQDDINTSDVTVTTNGKIFRTTKSASVGISVGLLTN